MKHILIVLLIFGNSCSNKENIKTNDNIYQSDSVLIKYFEDKNVVVVKKIRDKAGNLDIKKIMADGSFELYTTDSIGNLKWDYHKYSSAGKLVTYAYYSANSHKRRFLFNANNPDLIEGPFIVDCQYGGDSLIVDISSIGHEYYNIVFHEIDTMHDDTVNTLEFSKVKHNRITFKPKKISNKFYADIKCYNLIPDSVINQVVDF